MNSNQDSLALAVGNRRRFLRTLAFAGGAAALAPVVAVAANKPRHRHPCWHAKSFALDVSGKGRFADVVGYYWPFPAPKEALAFASFELRMKFPYEERDLLHLEVYLLPPATVPFFGKNEPVPISDSITEVEEITVGPPVEYPPLENPPLGAKATFGLMGRVVENAVPSPFGPIVGKIALFGGAFDREGDDVNFYLLGGMVAGQHATFLRPFQETPGSAVEHARGSIHFHGY